MAADPVAEQNRAAWNAGRYEAWVDALGAPAVEAAKLVADPRFKLRRLLPHLGDVAGKRIANIQGSHGRVAVALALLGAEASVIDFAEENRRYALELAAAAGVAIDYRLADVIEAGELGLEPFDMLVMELGILWYHQDLNRFFAVMAALTRTGGRLVLEDFHPVERKLFQGGEGVLRDYFRAEPVVGGRSRPDRRRPQSRPVHFSAWTLGEIVTAVIGAGFRLQRLDERPSWTDPPIPGTFILVARR